MKGTRLFVFAIAGVAAAGILVGIVFIVRFAWPYLRAGWDVGGAMKKSVEAPGADALRKLGCTAAGALEIDRMSEGERLGLFEPVRQGAKSYVWCRRAPSSNVSCDEVLDTYLGAVLRAPAPIVVWVSDPSGNETICDKTYGSSSDSISHKKSAAPQK